jgi:urea transport system substrate-binding protein
VYCPSVWSGAPPLFSTDPTANQRVVPALDYLVSTGRTAIHLVLGDDPLSRATRNLVRAYPGVTVVGTSGGWDARLASVPTRSHAVLSTLGRDETVRFLAKYSAAGLSADRLPVLSVGLTGADVSGRMAGMLLAGAYFDDLPGAANTAFVAAYRGAYGAGRPIGERAETAYLAVYVWRAMVAKSGVFDAERILAGADGLVLDAPEGRVAVDGPSRHLYRVVRVGTVDASGTVRELWNTGAPVRPLAVATA